MALYDGFSPPINSTGSGLLVNAASTGAVAAVIDSTQLAIMTGAATLAAGSRFPGKMARLTATLGGDTLASWYVEHSASSTITDATKLSAPIRTPTGQSGVYTFTLKDITPGDYVRARTASTFTGTLTAFLQIDPLA
jgi:hypothetical protein